MLTADPMPAAPSAWTGGILTIDLDAVAANYRILRDRVGPRTICGAAVKADAYGLGAARIVPVLAEAGCHTFFVAHLAEGAAIRPLLGTDATIFVLNGAMPGTEAALHEHGLVPVLNSLEQIARWRDLARQAGRDLPAALQVDSGMSRFGLSDADVDALAARDGSLAGITPLLVMSHLACADEPAHPANHAQRAAFLRLRARLPAAPASLAASSGLFMGSDWHFDMVRPGAALYGINPTPGWPNPMQPVVRLQARIVQTRWIGPGTAVGYGAAFIADRPSRIATLAVGYGDGFPRAAGGHGHAVLPERPAAKLPIIGRISMDCLAVDVTDISDAPLDAGTALDLIGPHHSIDSAAAAAGTIGYELLTGLGARYHRLYRDDRSRKGCNG
ncbi:alanine racemase [Gluconacetobacter diazotrophicus]|uniref:Alanine racemase n=1 Tax=Gluconacetobacter diazotrophicus (strain ATCC 49037 / DSM 5601 / CCUG 37298 / CIP 103539 / LMG 7603 / PAl5) TaxID=272568 RepID=A9H9C8_GLUDA|nr:alanine racemase [Gluconacetobacter diazotrophicus]CAP54653.1 putative alanine racemase, catabolic [Gluconacetobacter diazotrophicus PA1 5]